jgi:hypothetical protein
MALPRIADGTIFVLRLISAGNQQYSSYYFYFIFTLFLFYFPGLFRLRVEGPTRVVRGRAFPWVVVVGVREKIGAFFFRRSRPNPADVDPKRIVGTNRGEVAGTIVR